MSNFYSLDLGTHHAIVMAYHDAQGIVPACIMKDFPSEYKDSDGTPIMLAVIEDQHAIDRKDIYLVSEGAGRRITEIDEPFLMPNHVIRDDEVTPKPKEIIRYIPEHSFKIQSREDY